MLESLHLKKVGPAPEMKMDLATRLNLVTGDNGLGKTLLLDCAWFALSGTWPVTWDGKGVVPEKEDAEIAWMERRGKASLEGESRFDFGQSAWADSRLRTNTSEVGPKAIVVYLRVDGGISILDPLRAREGVRSAGTAGPWPVLAEPEPVLFQFRDADIFDGLDLRLNKPRRACEGLVRDVARWAVERDSAEFERLAALVGQLAGDEQFRLIRKVGRVYVDDARDYPFLSGPAGELPVAQAPAGLRRILGLAYLVVWAWREHKIAAGLKKQAPSDSLVLLIDEVESHLHPKWQRTILPSLLQALGKDVQLQIIATTHSPMVLASVEPSFDVASDKLFQLDLKNHVVTLEEKLWAKQGDVVGWLVSDTFGLQQARSVEAEKAIEAAESWMRGDTTSLPPDLATKEAIHAELQRVLPGHDPFWPRWVVTCQKAEGKP